MLSINVFAEKKAKSARELKLVEYVSKNLVSDANSLISENVDINITDKYGQSLLMLAAQNKNKELVNLLVEKGANPNYEIKENTSYDQLNSIRTQSLFGKRVLDLGVLSNDTAMIDLLIELGAKLDVDNKELGSIVANASDEDYPDMVRHLLKKGAKVSDHTGQSLVVSWIKRMTDPAYGRRVIDNNTDFRLIKVWDDYGIPLDEKILQAEFAKTNKDREDIQNYMFAYLQWVADGCIPPQQQNDKVYAKPMPYTSDEARFDSLARLAEARLAKEGIGKPQKNTNSSSKNWTNEIILLVSIIILCIYIVNRKKITVFCNLRAIFHKPSINNQTQVQQTERVRDKTQNLVLSDEIQNKLPEKGWTVDNTLMLEVNYLTIEDIINPIRLTNQDERDVIEIIQFVRKIERTDADKKEVREILISKWKEVDHNLVRSVFKRSLIIIVKNYFKQDQLVQKSKSKIE